MGTIAAREQIANEEAASVAYQSQDDSAITLTRYDSDTTVKGG
jgi:hypothetical protein